MNNALKTPIARSLEAFAGRKAALADQQLGWDLPCHVVKVVSSGIVTVAFDLQGIPYTIQNMTVPVLAFEYVRYPIQVGCKGRTIAADAYLGGVSGLGGGIADLTRRPNLSNLNFMPMGNSGWSATDDANAVVIYGPDGAIIRTMDSTSKLQINAAGAKFTIPAGGGFSIDNLPVAPGTTGSLYNSGGTVMVAP